MVFRVLFFVVYFCFVPNLWILAEGEEGSCGGSLGENIFTNGDFGAGVPNVVLNNPQIAPGYNYSTVVPPPDGHYTITNNMGVWPNLYSSWLPIRDSSSDPLGYMMVVNADYTPGLFYEETVNDLCSNTQYEFSADIINVVRTGVADHTLPIVDFALNGEVFLSTGAMSQSEKWNNYSFTFCTGENETSMVLSLINNAPGGYGNDLALDNITFRACGPEARIVTGEEVSYFCLGGGIEDFVLESTVGGETFTHLQWQIQEEGSSQWQNIGGATETTYALTDLSSGTFYYRYLLANSPENLQNSKCRLISSAKEVVILPIEYEVDVTICDGLIYTVGSSEYQNSGTYVDPLTSSRGCDSIVTTNLTILEDPNIEIAVSMFTPLCVGQANGRIEVKEVLRGNPPYQFILDESVSNTTGLFNNLTVGTYQLEVVDQYGCNNLTSIMVDNPPILEVETFEDKKIFIGEEITLNTSATQSELGYSWTPSEGLSCIDCPDPIVTPFESRLYKVRVQNEGGCTAMDSVYIEVDRTFKLAIPTAFSPNEDGVNDYFEIAVPFAHAIQSMRQAKVFNRWGQVVFEENEPISETTLLKWDGRNNFRLMDTSVYVYYVELELIDGSVQHFSGTITVTH